MSPRATNNADNLGHVHQCFETKQLKKKNQWFIDTWKMFVFTGIQYLYLDKTRNHPFSHMQQRPKKREQCLLLVKVPSKPLIVI